MNPLLSDTTTQQQDQFFVAGLFEPFRSVLNNFIDQNKELREEINQLRNNNEQLHLKIDEFKRQSQVQLNEQLKTNEELKTDIDQLKKQNEILMNEQLEKNKTIEFKINELNEKTDEKTTFINKLQDNDKNQNTQLVEAKQHHNQLEINVKSIRNHIICFNSK